MERRICCVTTGLHRTPSITRTTRMKPPQPAHC